MGAAEWISVVIGILGCAGLIFTALKYNRDDTTALVNQQNVIVADMKTLNDELRTTADQLRAEVARLSAKVRELSEQLRELRPDRDP